MVIAKQTETAPADPATFWEQYLDVERWGDWAPPVERVALEGRPRPGARGEVVLRDGTRAPFKVTWFVPGHGFTVEVRLRFARLTLSHLLEPLATGTRFTHRIDATGPLAGCVAREVGAALRGALPGAMQRLAAVVAGDEIAA